MMPETHQQHHHNRMYQINREQPIKPAGIGNAVSGFHPDCDECHDGQGYSGCREPALGATDLSRCERSTKAPQIAISGNEPHESMLLTAPLILRSISAELQNLKCRIEMIAMGRSSAMFPGSQLP